MNYEGRILLYRTMALMFIKYVNVNILDVLKCVKSLT